MSTSAASGSDRFDPRSLSHLDEPAPTSPPGVRLLGRMNVHPDDATLRQPIAEGGRVPAATAG